MHTHHLAFSGVEGCGAISGGFGNWRGPANHERGGLRPAHKGRYASEGAKVKRATAPVCVNNAGREYGCSVGAKL